MLIHSPLDVLPVGKFDPPAKGRILPLFVACGTNGEKNVSLFRTEAPLCTETRNRLTKFQAVIVVFDTEAQALVFRDALSSVMSEVMEVAAVWRTGACLLILSGENPSRAFLNLFNSGDKTIECGQAQFGFHDRRVHRTTAEIIFSFDISHAGLREFTMMNDVLHKDPDSASEALLMLIEKDLNDDTVLRFLQDKISRLYGASVPIISLSHLDVQERLEDEAEEEIDFDFWSSVTNCLSAADISEHLAGVKEMVLNRTTDISLGFLTDGAQEAISV